MPVLANPETPHRVLRISSACGSPEGASVKSEKSLFPSLGQQHMFAKYNTIFVGSLQYSGDR